MQKENRVDRMLPDIILAGAPKCGTTSVFDYLRGHPQICASSVKETYYLMDTEYPLARAENIHRDGLAGYERYFSHCGNSEDRFKLEATPDYMYQVAPLKCIPDWPKKPKVFFILRRPEERVYSLYRFSQNNMAKFDNRISFSMFIQLLDSGALNEQGLEIESNVVAHSKYIYYLRRWKSVLGMKNIGIFLFEDLARDPGSFMKNVCQFLEIDPGYYDSYNFHISNRSYNVKYQRLHRVKKLVAKAFPQGRYRALVSRLYMRLNTTMNNPITDEDKAELRRLGCRFKRENEMLAQEFNVDVSGWNSEP